MKHVWTTTPAKPKRCKDLHIFQAKTLPNLPCLCKEKMRQDALI